MSTTPAVTVLGNAVQDVCGNVELGPLSFYGTVGYPQNLLSYVRDLERRYRLLLQDYILKFGPVPSLSVAGLPQGDENAIALVQT